MGHCYVTINKMICINLPHTVYSPVRNWRTPSCRFELAQTLFCLRFGQFSEHLNILSFKSLEIKQLFPYISIDHYKLMDSPLPFISLPVLRTPIKCFVKGFIDSVLTAWLQSSWHYWLTPASSSCKTHSCSLIHFPDGSPSLWSLDEICSRAPIFLYTLSIQTQTI